MTEAIVIESGVYELIVGKGGGWGVKTNIFNIL